MCVFIPLDSRLILKWNSFCKKKETRISFCFGTKKKNERKQMTMIRYFMNTIVPFDILWDSFCCTLNIPEFCFYIPFWKLSNTWARTQSSRTETKMCCKWKYARDRLCSWSLCSTSVTGRKRLYFFLLSTWLINIDI